MRKILSLLLSVSIVCCYVTSCEEAAYALGESGSMKRDQCSLSELDGSEICTCTPPQDRRSDPAIVVP